ncbi:MAG: hypothetical protein V1882_01995 [Candidatus Omnitrophota bacterium]
MGKHFLKNELEAMLRFHKAVLLVILRTIGCVLRYGAWLLPWIFFATCVWKPMLEDWRSFTQGASESAQVRQQTMPSYGVVAPPVRSLALETIQNRVDSGMRTVERLSKQIRKK